MTEVAEFVGDASEPQQFWQQVKTNLQAGRIRMVFVADDIPPELKRIVEFLNGQMDPAEVLAVEIKQFVNQNLRTLVPRVIGQTVEAERKKTTGSLPEKQWDEVSFVQELTAKFGDTVAEVARQIVDWAEHLHLPLDWGKGARDGSCTPVVEHKGVRHYPLCFYTYGRLEVNFQYMKTRPVFDSEIKRQELRIRLNRVPDVAIPEDAITRRPRILLASLAKPGVLNQFLDVMSWVVNEIRGS